MRPLYTSLEINLKRLGPRGGPGPEEGPKRARPKPYIKIELEEGIEIPSSFPHSEIHIYL